MDIIRAMMNEADVDPFDGDMYEMIGGCGITLITSFRPGITSRIRLRFDPENSGRIIPFDPVAIGEKDRDDLVRKLLESGMPRSSVAELLDIPISTVIHLFHKNNQSLQG